MDTSEHLTNAATVASHTTNSNLGVFVVDTAKMLLPVGVGSGMSFIHTADEFVTFATHVVGLCAAVVGLAWYVIRLRKDLRAPKRRRERAEKDGEL